MVLAVDIIGDGAANGDITGAGRDRKKPASRDTESEYFVQSYSGLAAQNATLLIERLKAVEAARIQEGPIRNQADIPVTATHSDGEHSRRSGSCGFGSLILERGGLFCRREGEIRGPVQGNNRGR